MNPDDELLRKALLRDMPAPEAYRTLQTLRPAMNRARARRRAVVSAVTAALVIGGGAAVLAVNSSIQDSRQTVTSDMPTPAPVIQRVEPEPTEAPTTNAPVVESSTTATIATTTEAPAEPTTIEPDEIEPPAVVTPNAGPPAALAPSTPAPAPAPAPAPVERLERVESQCGVLVVAVNGNHIGVAELEPADGFSARVSDSGPKSIELKFVGGGRTCELHVESEHGRLHVEVQDH